MRLDPLRRDDLTSFHHLCHLIDRYHFDRISNLSDTSKSKNDFLYMLRFESLTKDHSRIDLTMENIQNIEWVTLVDELDELIGYLEYKLAFLARNDLD